MSAYSDIPAHFIEKISFILDIVLDRRALLSSQTATFVGTCKGSLRHLLCELRMWERDACVSHAAASRIAHGKDILPTSSLRDGHARVSSGAGVIRLGRTVSYLFSIVYLMRLHRKKRAPVALNFLTIRKPRDAVRLRDTNIIFHSLCQM